MMKKNERGQVLLLSVVIMIVLAMMVVFIFDLHLAVRAKMKVETAEQAAALTAAEWQRNTLNLIGELNLIKAGEIMLEDFSPPLGTAEERLKESTEFVRNSCRAMTEMQSRLSFVGPLIAFGAAQQAGKYNGANIYDREKRNSEAFFDEDESRYESESNLNSDKKYIYDDIRDYRRKLEMNSRYLDHEYCHYYAWREPYIRMLTDIRDRGLAMRGSGINMMNSITPAWLADENVYNTILLLHRYGVETIRGYELKYWGILEKPESFWEGNWWKVSYILSAFPQQSEIYPIYTAFSTYTPNDYDTLESIYRYFTNNETPILQPELLAEITWCTYSSEWSHTTTRHDSGWYDGSYLRDKVKDTFLYNGPVAAAQTYERIQTVSRYRTDIAPSTTGFAQTEAAAQRAFRRTTESGGIVKEVPQMNFLVGSDPRFNDVGGVTAKVLGQLNDNTPPHVSGLILPVFHGVSMIPSTMFSYTMFRAEYTNLERFLMWLSGLNTLFPPTISLVDDSGNQSIIPSSPPNGTSSYYEALEILQDVRFRRSIWNPDYVLYSVTFEQAFEDDYKYNPSRNSAGLDAGAGWLQQAYVGPRQYELGREKEYDWHYQYPDDVDKSKYLLTYKNRPGKYVTNEEYYLYTYTGSGGEYYRGQNVGPPRL
jgi:hypothetical protein